MVSSFENSKIKGFLKDFSHKQITIPYKGKRLNAACDWRKFRKPLVMLSRALLNEVLKKIPPCLFKNHLYRLMGVKIGEDVAIAPNVSLDPLFPELITIEDGVILGWGCKIFAHEFLKDKIRLGRVVIKKNALIGGYSLIRAGVTIGENSVISFYSLVNKDVGDNKSVGGIPAKKIKTKT